MSECVEHSDTDEPIDGPSTDAEEAMLDPESDEEKGTSIWFLLGMGFLMAVLIWIVFGVWRFLQVMSYGP
jgi:hypothetical protein